MKLGDYFYSYGENGEKVKKIVKEIFYQNGNKIIISKEVDGDSFPS